MGLYSLICFPQANDLYGNENAYPNRDGCDNTMIGKHLRFESCCAGTLTQRTASFAVILHERCSN